MKNKIRSRFSPRPVFEKKEYGKSLTQQHDAQGADINRIVEKHLGRGRQFRGVPSSPGATRTPMFGDFTSNDFQAMQNKIADVHMHFTNLPARLRGRFSNDPMHLLRFVEDPANRKEAVELGLLGMTEEEYLAAAARRPQRVVQTDLVEQAEEEEAQEKEPQEAPKPPKKGEKKGG